MPPKKYTKKQHKAHIKDSLSKMDGELDKKFDEALEVPEHIVKPPGSGSSHKLTKIQVEHRMMVLQKLLFRQVPTAQICKVLNISERMFFKLKKQLKERVLMDVQKMHYPTFVGETLAFYDEIRSLALVMSTDKNISDNRIKLQAMQTALRAEGQKHEFLAISGAYKSPQAQTYMHKMMSTAQPGSDNDLTMGIDPQSVLNEVAGALLRMKKEQQHQIEFLASEAATVISDDENMPNVASV